MTAFHFPHKFRKIIKVFAQSKIFIGIHVIDIHIDHIQRDMILAIAFCHFSEVFFCLVSPAALTETKSEFRRDIAPAGQMAELLYYIIRRAPGYHIEIKVGVFAGYGQSILSRVPDIKCQAGGIVKKHAEGLFSPDNDEVVGSIKRELVLGMVRIVRTVADIAVTPLVDAPVRLA